MAEVSESIRNRIEFLYEQESSNFSQEDIERLESEFSPWRNILLPGESDEVLGICDASGHLSGITAPRWLCHLLGLRHQAVHILLGWQSPKLGLCWVLQLRSWDKADAPAHLDISAAGHVSYKFSSEPEKVALQELNEELGIEVHKFIETGLKVIPAYEMTNRSSNPNFRNREWCHLYYAEISQDQWNNINFNDGEVSGLMLVPASQSNSLLNSEILPQAAALKYSLYHFISTLQI